jgi:predicted acetyltransferase
MKSRQIMVTSTPPSPMKLVRPSAEQLPSVIAALRRGWLPDHLRAESGRAMLDQITRDPQLYLAHQDDLEGQGPAVTLPDGSVVARLPGFRRWMWDGEFCGLIGLRWQPGTVELPPHVLGHIGYAVVPWKQRLGYATRALRLLLPEARQLGLPYVEITTDADNLASQRVIEANGGRLVERFCKAAMYGGTESLRFRISLADSTVCSL